MCLLSSIKLFDKETEYMETPREIVIRALKFQSPQRIPRQLWPLPCAQKEYPDHFKHLVQEYPD